MIIELKRPVEFPDTRGGKAPMKVGQHTIENELLNHWFVKGLIAEGSIVILGESAPAPVTLIYPTSPERKVVNTVTVKGVSGEPHADMIAASKAEIVPEFDDIEVAKVKEYLGKAKDLETKDVKPAPKVPVKKAPAKNPVKSAIKRRA